MANADFMVTALARLEGADRVAPHLWMGAAPPSGPLLREQRFDVLVLCAMEYQPDDAAFPGVRVLRCPLDDSTLPATDQRLAHLTAREVHALRLKGKRVLVTCRMGLNRSGLVTALALVRNGMPPDRAIALVRNARTQDALGNGFFVRMIQAAAR